MSKKRLLTLSILGVLALTACSKLLSNSSSSEDTSSSSSENNGSPYDYNSSISVPDPEDIDVDESTDDFALTTSDGTISQEGNVYTLTAAGTYKATGRLEGQIVVNAGDEDEVVLELTNATIIYDQDSPIKCLKADKVEISAKKDTGNMVTDNRSPKTADSDELGEGAIHSDVDLKIKGAGTLVVIGNYNNGIHSKKDFTMQKAKVKVTGYNNAVKGKDSVTIESGELQAFANNGNGIKTDNSDVSSKGKQRGSITVNGGAIYVNSLHDAIDASYNVEINQAADDVDTTLSIKTGNNSSTYNSSFVADSEKGLKAANEIIINRGVMAIAAGDDAIHANYGDVLENGEKGLGNITINDGLIQIASGDDGLHADNTLTINNGKVVVAGAVEGFEANYITINGGYSYIYGSDDGVNCARKMDDATSCCLTISGGYLDVAVNNGDTDGIDSNGDLYITGGTVITRGSPGTRLSGMSTGLDVDGICSMSGGTLIAFNGLEKKPTTSGSVIYAGTSTNEGYRPGPGGGGPGGGGTQSNLTLNAGEYHLTGDGLDVSFINDFVYGGFMIYSSSLILNSSYTLSLGETSVLSWTQSSNSTTISVS